MTSISRGDFQRELLVLDPQQSEFQRWRRALCIGQWAVDDCSGHPSDDAQRGDMSVLMVGVGPVASERYARVAEQALINWDYALSTSDENMATRLAESLLSELRRITPDEASEPDTMRWVGPAFDSRSIVHVGCVSGDAWGLLCDCTVSRRYYSDRVRGGMLTCQACAARLVSACGERNPERRDLGLHLLQQVGWKDTDPLPVILRTNELKNSWVTRWRKERGL